MDFNDRGKLDTPPPIIDCGVSLTASEVQVALLLTASQLAELGKGVAPELGLRRRGRRGNRRRRGVGEVRRGRKASERSATGTAACHACHGCCLLLLQVGGLLLLLEESGLLLLLLEKGRLLLRLRGVERINGSHACGAACRVAGAVQRQDARSS